MLISAGAFIVSIASAVVSDGARRDASRRDKQNLLDGFEEKLTLVDEAFLRCLFKSRDAGKLDGFEEVLIAMEQANNYWQSRFQLSDNSLIAAWVDYKTIHSEDTILSGVENWFNQHCTTKTRCRSKLLSEASRLLDSNKRLRDAMVRKKQKPKR